MKPKTLLLIVTLALVATVTYFYYSVKNRKPLRPAPEFYHTPAGVNSVIQEQRTVLVDALGQKDLQFIHGQMYYIEGLVDALGSKLEGEQKQLLSAHLNEIKRIAEELDNFSGRGNLAATDAGLKKLFVAFAALDKEFKPEKK